MQTIPQHRAGTPDLASNAAPSTRRSTAPVDAAALPAERREGAAGHSRYFLRFPVFAVANGDRATPGGVHAADRVVWEAAHLAARLAARARVRRARNDAATASALLRIPVHCHNLLRVDRAWSPELAGMATTLALVLIDWPVAHVVSVGDSPCFLLRDGTLVSLADTPPEHARGISADDSEVEARHVPVGLRPRDALIICTAGMTAAIPEPQLAHVVKTAASASEACAWLAMAIGTTGPREDASGIVVRFLNVGVMGG